MKPEIEVKFLNVDHDEMRAKLKTLGAECVQKQRIMRRKTFDYPDGRLRNGKGGLVRVRDEGNKVTLTYKEMKNRTLDGTCEINLVVDSFENAAALFENIEFAQKSYQETKRESWRLDHYEIELDEWPWTKPYVEIEGPDESSLKQLAQSLNLDWAHALHGTVEVVYQAEYDISEDEFNTIKNISFDEPKPTILRLL